MKKRTILHVIDSLGRGGAETLLVGYIKDLSIYDHILVYLGENNEFEKELNGIEVIKLGFDSKALLPVYALKLFLLINKRKVDVIHSHLYWSTIIARLANFSNLPHIFSIHNKINETVFLKHPYTKIIERATYKQSQIGVAVSLAVKEDYISAIQPKGEIVVLYNFIADKFYNNKKDFKIRGTDKELKLVSVGNLKGQKNYPYLIEAFSYLKKEPISLDIYGSGPMLNELTTLIEKYEVGSSVTLMGSVSDLENILPSYDAFVMASTVEGFGLAPIEALTMGLPLLLSDINVLKEVASHYAFYFDPYKIQSFLDLIHSILDKGLDLDLNIIEGMNYTNKFTKANYLNELSNLYTRALLKSSS